MLYVEIPKKNLKYILPSNVTNRIFFLFPMSIWNDQTTYTAVRKEEERFLYIYTPLNCPESRNRDKFLSIKTHPNDCHIIVYIKLILKFVFVFTFCSERNN